MPHPPRSVGRILLARSRRSALIVAGLSLLLAVGGRAKAQIELRLGGQDPFSTFDQVPPPISRELLKNVSIDPDVQNIVSRLNSDDFAEREAATDLLRRNENWRMQMYALLAGEDLTVEQRCRLLQVVRDQLLNTPRGALGIEMAPMLPMRGGPLEIRVVDLIAGLPAERVMQVGDRIIEIDGQPLFMEDDLQSRVQSKRPGDNVSVTVKRAKLDDNGRVLKDANDEPVTEILRLDIALGSAEILDRQQRNLRVISNRVQNARRIEAESITYAFAPQPLMVSVDGGIGQLTHDDPIDQHPAIVNLLAQQSMLSDRNPEHTRMMQEIWRRQLADLIDLANHPGLSVEERARMRRVAERFMELMNAGM